MTRHPRAHLARSTALGAAVFVAAGLVSTPSQAAELGRSTASIAGTLLVAPSERPGQPTEFAVQTADGSLVEIAGSGLSSRDAGAGFRGTVAIPASLRGRTEMSALHAVQAQHAVLEVTSSTLSRSQQASAASAGTTHRWFLIAPSNLGAQGMSDADLITQVKTVATYWKSQSNGAISGVTVPTAISRYSAKATSTAAGCGLVGTDFWATVQEAAAQFPTANFGGTDQLVVLMPAGCSGTGVTGRAGLGSLSFARGGYSVVRTDPRWFQQSLAHELGHNYGFDHSRLGPCDPSCTSDYGDLYSVMGGAVTNYIAPLALSSAYRQLQGVTVTGEVETLRFKPGVITYTRTIYPRSATSGLRGLAVPASADGTGLIYLDFRNGSGVDQGAFYTAGGSSGFKQGLVAEVVNNTNGIALMPDNGRKAIAVGETRSLAGGKVTLRVDSISGSGVSQKMSVTVTIDGGNPAYPSAGKVQLSVLPTVDRSVEASTSGFTATGTTFAYQWLLGGAPIPGATGRAYAPTGDQTGKPLSVQVVASAPSYNSVTVTSAAAPVAAGTLTSAVPTITGTPAVGQTLGVLPGTWTPGVTFTYQWVAGGVAIPGATSSQFTPTTAQKGKGLVVMIVGSMPGYTSVSKTSYQVTVR